MRSGGGALERLAWGVLAPGGKMVRGSCFSRFPAGGGYDFQFLKEGLAFLGREVVEHIVLKFLGDAPDFFVACPACFCEVEASSPAVGGVCGAL